MKIGVVGAGHIGRAMTKVAIDAGHEVMLANSRGPESLQALAKELGCRTGTVAEATRYGELVILAIPFNKIRQLDPADFAGRIVLDANNYYPGRDTAVEALDKHQATTSGLVQQHLAGARVVKFFNAIMFHDIEAHRKPHGASDRRALPIAGDDAEAKRIAATLMDQIGYDPVDGGSLDESWRFERAMPGYCVPLDAAHMRTALAAARRGEELPHGSWRAPRPLNGPPPASA
ncbi:NAD(P)-binding domain-containing protein [Variovorax defluvii]|uniref:NAD(P)-binding domain-containing protein n=1 Tax=Variovorax defluvii TaxID=913761 RepID=A0ABP8HXY8_9BURK